jgi:predicted Zn-dependent peptidase
MSFDAGRAADPADAQGTQAMMLAMLKEGTATRNSIQIAEEQERLGASIDVGASFDRTTVSLYALTPNLAPSLDLLADIILRPSFDPKEMERVRATQLAQIAQERTQPRSLASQTLMPMLYGKNHPYGIAASGSGDPEAVRALTRDALIGFHRRWIRPDTAEIFAVGNTTLPQLKAELEKRFTAWPATRDMPGRKNFDIAPPPPAPRIVLVDRPQSPQSTIYAGHLLKGKGGDDLVDLLAANDILGGNFLSRINMDLRETKGWSYGVNGAVQINEHAVPYIVSAPVQADRTGESIAALKHDFVDFLTTHGVTEEELTRTVANNIQQLPGQFETSDAVLSAMQRIDLLDRPDNFYELLAAKYRAQTQASLDSAVRSAVDPDAFVWIVVGDAAKVKPQLDKLKMPVEVVEAK